MAATCPIETAAPTAGLTDDPTATRAMPEPTSAEGDTTRSAEASTGAKTDTAWASSTYFAEGLPFSIVHKVSSEFLVHLGVSAQLVGLFQLAHVPWNLKFVWAPLVDRFGTTKRWMVAAQLAIAACTLFLAAFASTFVPWAFGTGLMLIAVFAATNDIAVDGYFLRRLKKERQDSLAGVRVGAYRVALMVGSGGIVTLGGLYGFQVAFGAAGLIMGGLALAHGVFLAKDRAEEGSSSVSGIVQRAAKSFFSQRGIGVAMVVLLTYRAGDALMFAMNAKFLAELGLSTATRGVINGTFGTVASIGGSLTGAAIIARVSFARAFVPITAAQSGAILLYVLLAVTRPSLPFVAAVVLVEQFIAGVGISAFFVFITRLCQGEQKATQYAFASSLMSVAMLGAGAGSGFLFASFGSAKFFFVAFLASLPGMLATAFYKPNEARTVIGG